VIVAIEMIKKLTKDLKYIRKIYLVTNGDGLIDSDDVEDIANQLVDRSISLTVL
jgi:ATP-dependent DNA helicase 2 subunit 2